MVCLEKNASWTTLVVQWVKDPGLSLQWLGLLLWVRSLAWELLHVTGAARKEKKKKKNESGLRDHCSHRREEGGGVERQAHRGS